MRLPLVASAPLLLFQSLLPSPTPPEVTLSPRHAHAHALDPAAPLFLNDGGTALHTWADEEMTLRTRKVTIKRPRQRPPHMLSWAHAARARRHGTNVSATGWDSDDDWDEVEVEAPDVTDRQTLLTLAKMSSNSYIETNESGWFPLPGFNDSIPYGWEPDADGLRGHIFADAKNTTVVIAIKGTSAGMLGTGGPTSKNDKFNDNLMFSCCCARVDFSWSTVCDCYAGNYKCEQTCLETALVEESVYATVGTNLYNNVTYMYPNANIWLTGHSLGGALASLIALSFGAPAIGYEAPGDRLPARRLHLPGPPAVPPEKMGITHVYHTADPIPMGACTGTISGCYVAGFALESKCHNGETILYDTVTVKGWSVDIRTHRIIEVINKVLVDPWPTGGDDDDDDSGGGGGGGGKDDDDDDIPDPGTGWFWWGWGGRDGKKKPDWNKHGGVPKAKAETDCVDCYKWEFGDGWNDKEQVTPNNYWKH